jgi:hypothetical protein
MNSDQWLYIAAGILLGIGLLYLFIRWAFDIPKRNRIMEAQMKILGKIAEKNGANRDEIESIINDATHSRDVL